MRKALLMVAVCATLLKVSTAQAAGTDEQKCLAGRAKAKGTYEQCVAKWLSKVSAGASVDLTQEKVAKCRIKYAAAWTKLQKLTGSTTCVLARFVDNGITVTDNLTGLVWEKKTTAVGSGTDLGGDRHDVDNFYSWSTADGDLTDEDGTLFTDFFTNLNAGGGFASANGWRLPTLAELQTILLAEPYPCTTNPCIEPTFGPTQSGHYWSASSFAEDNTDFAWYVRFVGGYVYPHNTDGLGYVRAVRGGL